MFGRNRLTVCDSHKAVGWLQKSWNIILKSLWYLKVNLCCCCCFFKWKFKNSPFCVPQKNNRVMTSGWENNHKFIFRWIHSLTKGLTSLSCCFFSVSYFVNLPQLSIYSSCNSAWIIVFVYDLREREREREGERERGRERERERERDRETERETERVRERESESEREREREREWEREREREWEW